jgi:hypothetical protein
MYKMTIPPFEEYRLMPPEQRRAVRQQQLQLGVEVYSSRKGLSSVLKGRPLIQARGPRGERPETWIVGPNELRHNQYGAWHKHRSQAHYRGEEHELTFEEWEYIWQDQWTNRGRRTDSTVLTRTDPEKSWCMDNVELVTREECIRRSTEYARLKKL